MPFTSKVIAAVFVAALILCIGSGRASAHAVLLKTSPGQNESVKQAPKDIILRFNEPVAPIKLQVIDSNGNKVTATGKVSAIDLIVRLPLTAPLAEGRYIVSYRVVSLDSHPVAASFLFAVGDVPAAGKEIEQIQSTIDDDGGAAIPAYLNRAIRYGALLLAAGMGFFLVLFQLPNGIAVTVQRGLIVAAATGIVSSILMVGLGGAELSGSGLDGLILPGIWALGAQATLATSAAVAGLGLMALILGCLTKGTQTKIVLLVGGGVLAIASLGFTGHAAVARPAWMMTPSVLVHALMAAFWFGALWPLGLVLKTCPMETAADLLHRFSKRAILIVAVMILSALVLSVVQIEQVNALVTTDYGVLLAVKVALVGLLLCLAVANRWRYLPRLSQGDSAARRRLRTTIRAELVLATLVVAVAAGLGTVPPPRSLTAAAPPSDPLALRRMASAPTEQRRTITGSDGVKLTLTITPARPGTNTIDLQFQKPDSTPLEPQEVTVLWSHRGAGIEPLQKRTTQGRKGRYRVPGVQMIVAGQWDLRIDALVDDFTKTIFRTVVSIDALGAKNDDRKGRQFHQGFGIIVSTDLEAGRIVIDHEEIKGFMAAMVMNYSVVPPALLANLKPGDRVSFTIDAGKRMIIEIKPFFP